MKIRIEFQRFLCFKAQKIYLFEMNLLFSYQIFWITSIDFLWGLNYARASQCRLVILLKTPQSGATCKLDPDLLLPISKFSLLHHIVHSSFGSTFTNRCDDASAHTVLHCWQRPWPLLMQSIEWCLRFQLNWINYTFLIENWVNAF